MMSAQSEKTQELLRKVRKIEIKSRGLSDQLFSGGYHSAFKGRGMSFSEVRSYQYGDDVRNIDWNVTARMRDPYVKVFEEEREITVMLLVDVSPSTFFGTQLSFAGQPAQKHDIIAEICAVLSFSAINNNDKVGLVLFSDEVELFVPPKKGRNHILRIIRELVSITPTGKGTDLEGVLRQLNNLLKKRSIVFVISDFMNQGPDYRDAVSLARKRHDVVGLHLWDTREKNIPNLGLVRVEDAETGTLSWIDTSNKKLRQQYQERFEANLKQAKETFLRSGADFVSINTRESYINALLGLFSRREQRR